MICSTEPLKTISDDRLFQLKHIIPVENVKVVPLDLFSGKRYPSLIKVHLPKQRAFQPCYINWSDEETIPVKLTLNKEVLGIIIRIIKPILWLSSLVEILLEALNAMKL